MLDLIRRAAPETMAVGSIRPRRFYSMPTDSEHAGLLRHAGYGHLVTNMVLCTTTSWPQKRYALVANRDENSSTKKTRKVTGGNQ
jgi:hypothetical protein